MNPIRKIGLSIAAAALLLTSVNAGGGMTGGATEFTQLANNSELGALYSKELQQYSLQIQQYQQQVQQYVDQMRMYQTMLENLGQLPQAQWTEFEQSVVGLQNIMDQTGGMTFVASNFNDQFSQMYQGYDEYFKLANGGSLDASSIYKNISDETRKTVNSSLKALNLSMNDIKDDTSTMRELEHLSMSASGQKAAIQAANEIALHQTNQLKRLHQTMLVQSNVQQQAIVAQQTKEDAAKAHWDKWFGGKRPDRTNNRPLPKL